jgi:hypothetical protein
MSLSLPTVTLPLIDDDMTIKAVFERLRQKQRGGFVLGDPNGGRVVTAAALEDVQRAGAFDDSKKIADLRERIIPTWDEPKGFLGRLSRRVKVGGVSVPRELAERPQEGYAILDMDQKTQSATVLANDSLQLEELLTPPD